MQIGLVLPGGGARGAYEAGALSVLIPALAARGERVEIVCGTSVGGINAAVVAAVAGLDPAAQAETFLERWRSVRKGNVIRPVIGIGTAIGLLRLAGEILELPGLRAASLLDPAPLARSLESWIDWDALHDNVAAGLIAAVCVVATSVERGVPVGFVESAAPPPRSDREIEYVHTRLEGQHVRASAAIPMLFPPVAVSAPLGAAGHYVDGATRLNAPIAPALALGAERVIVVGYEPFAAQRPAARAERAAAGRRGRERARRPAARPGRPRRAADARGQRVLRRAPVDRDLARGARLPRGPGAPALPADLLRARRARAARRDRRARRGDVQRALRRPARAALAGLRAAVAAARAAPRPPRAASCSRSSSSTRCSSSGCWSSAATTPSAGSPSTPGSGRTTPPRRASRRPEVSAEAVALDEFRAAAPTLDTLSGMLLLGDEALAVTLVALAIWVVVFPVLVQGLIVYAVILARGEKRENDAYRHSHE